MDLWIYKSFSRDWLYSVRTFFFGVGGEEEAFTHTNFSFSSTHNLRRYPRRLG